MYYGLLLFILIPQGWCSRSRPSHKKKMTLRNTSCSSISWWLSTQRRIKRTIPVFYPFSHDIYFYSRKKGVWPCKEVRHKWFIASWQAKTWNDNWRPVCSVRRTRSDWVTAVKGQYKEDFRRNSRYFPTRCSTSHSRFAVLLRLQALPLGDEVVKSRRNHVNVLK